MDLGREGVLKAWFREIKVALRGWRRSSTYILSVTVLLTVSLTIAGTAFTMLYSLLLRPLPYRDQDRLLIVRRTDPGTGMIWELSRGDLAELEHSVNSLERLEPIQSETYTVRIAGVDSQLWVGRVSSDFFHWLGVQPLLGSLSLPTQGDSVVISERFWRKYLYGNEEIVGSSLDFRDQGFLTIAGVLPDSARIPGVWSQLWRSGRAVVTPQDKHGAGPLTVLARLRPDASISVAREELKAQAERLREFYPEQVESLEFRASDALSELVLNHTQTIYVIQIASLVILLAAAASMANLMNADLRRKVGQFRIRLAIGASAVSIKRLVLTEAVLASLPSFFLAAWLTELCIGFAKRSGPASLMSIRPVEVDIEVLGFLWLVMLIFSAACSLVALRRETVCLDLSNRFGQADAHRLLRAGSLSLFVQVVLGLSIATGALEMTRSMRGLQEVQFGFEPEGLWFGLIQLPYDRYPTEVERGAFESTLLERLSEAPGVSAAAMVQNVPMIGGSIFTEAVIEGEGKEKAIPVLHQVASQSYLEAVRLEMAAGWWFTGQERKSSMPIAVVNETLGRRIAGLAAGAVGRRLSLDEGETWATVVGVVRDNKNVWLTEPIAPEVLVPSTQNPGGPGPLLLVRARPGLDPSSQAVGLIRSLDPHLSGFQLRSLTDWIRAEFGTERFVMVLLQLIAGACIALGLLGTYALARQASQGSMREFAVRLVLGSPQIRLIGLVLRKIVPTVLAGLFVGLLISVGFARLLSTLVYWQDPSDPYALLLAALTMGVGTIVAGGVPAWRASRLDPAQALRFE